MAEKLIKAVFIAITWIGVIIITLTICASFWMSWKKIFDPGSIGGVDFETPIAWILGGIGAVLMLIGGINSKPKFFWLVCITIGILYVVSFFGNFKEIPERIRYNDLDTVKMYLIYSILPALVCVIEGVFLKISEQKAKKQLNMDGIEHKYQ
jgi:hypothetical protein